MLRRGHRPIVAVVGAYVVLGTAYALRTPPWQVPDEPAHFNYVLHLAAHPFDAPEIEPGDYPFERLEALKDARFGAEGRRAWLAYERTAQEPVDAGGGPAVADVEGIGYEDHQPPAYYALAAVVWRLGALGTATPLHLRLLGVLLGAVTVWLAWRVAGLLYPGDAALAAATAAFVGFLPMFVYITAAVNNDPLAYAVMAAVLYVALGRLTGRVGRRRYVLVGGLLFGLAILTKVSVMAPAAVVLATVELMAWWRRGRFAAAMSAATVVQALGVGLLVGLPWLLRNARVYGAGDWFGLAAHDRVVACAAPGAACQPRTAAWIAEFGWGGYVERLAAFTFKSFWGVFGWMAVFLTEAGGVPIYGALAAASLVAAAGLVAYLARLARDDAPGASDRRWGLALLGVSLAVTVAGYLWYNWTFVQHQGRYLFPALVPIALGFMLGVREAAGRIARAAGLGPDGARRAERLALGGFALALFGLAWVSLWRFVVPALG